MSAMEHLGLSNVYDYPFSRLAHSTRLTVIAYVALTTLAILMIALSSWANFKVATLYGSVAIVQHSVYTTFLPLTIAALVVRVLYLLASYRKISPPLPFKQPTLSTFSSPMPGRCTLTIHIGDRVYRGDVIGIIECMKMEHTLRAETSGVIKEIFIQNGATLSFNQPILAYEKVI